MTKKSKSTLVSELLAKKGSSADKKSRSRSCLLCQRRKQKCDHRLPSCTTCVKAGVQCIQPEKYSADAPTKDEYTVVLERRIQFLESLIDVNPNGKVSLSNKCGSTTKKYKKLTPYIAAHTLDDKLLSKDEKFISNLVTSVENSENVSSESPKNGQNSENSSISQSQPSFSTKPDPFDPSMDVLSSLEIPTFSLINDPMRQIPDTSDASRKQQSSLENHSAKVPASNEFNSQDFNTNKIPVFLPLGNQSMDVNSSSILAESVDISNTILGKYDLKDIIKHQPEFDIEKTVSKTLINTHFIRFHIKFPFLDEQEILDFYHIYTSGKISINSIGKNTFRNNKKAPAYMNDPNHFYFCCCRMWLIYSLNLFVLKSCGDYERLDPLRLFSTALRFLSKCEITDPFRKLEILLLAILCLIRCDSDSLTLYSIIKDAMEISVSQLQLHKYATYQSTKVINGVEHYRSEMLQKFWCVYLLDRLIALSIGKPLSFPEHKIDSNIPLFDSSILSPSVDSNNANDNDFTAFINQSLKLKRIESKAIEALNITVGASNNEPANRTEIPLLEFYFDKLQAWRLESARIIKKEVERATLGLYYFRTIRVLIQPYLELLEPEDRLFRECQAAAGQICQLFKVFHQKTVYGHSTLAINNVFVAGVTLIYCLWLTRNTEDSRRKLLGDNAKHTRPTMTPQLFASLDDLRACSVCLFVMAERSKRYATVFRDTFDKLMKATIGNLMERCGPDSTEILYTRNNGHQNRKGNNIDDLSKSSNISGVASLKNKGFDGKRYQLGSPNNMSGIVGNDRNNRNIIVDKNSILNKNTIEKFGKQGFSELEKDRVMPPAVVRKPIFHFDIEPKLWSESQVSTTSFLRKQKDWEKDSKKKQGDLEKNVVPRGLKYLLSPSSYENESNTSSNNNYISSSSKDNNTQPSGQTNRPFKQENVESISALSKIHQNTINCDSMDNNGKELDPVSSTKVSQTFPFGNYTTNNNSLQPNYQNGNNYRNLNMHSNLMNSNSPFGDLSVPCYGGASISFTDRATDMINNINVWTEKSGPITANYALNDFAFSMALDSGDVPQQVHDGNLNPTPNILPETNNTERMIASDTSNSQWVNGNQEQQGPQQTETIGNSWESRADNNQHDRNAYAEFHKQQDLNGAFSINNNYYISNISATNRIFADLETLHSLAVNANSEPSNSTQNAKKRRFN